MTILPAMTVTSTATYSGPFTPNGVTTQFAFAFKAASASEIEARSLAGDTWATISPALYDVTVNSGDGGTITFTTAPAAAIGELYIFSDPLFTREANFGAEGLFSPAALNPQLDRAAVRDLYLKERVDSVVSDELLLASKGGKFLGWDAEGNPTALSGTGTDDALRDDLVASTGGALVGLLSLGVGGLARSLLAWFRDQPLTAEGFGAVGDVPTDDAAAFAKLITAAQAFSLPIRLKQGATYGLGAAAWTGLSATLTKDIDIDGNGATIKVLAMPTNLGVVGPANRCLLKFDGTASYYKLKIHNLTIDANGFPSGTTDNLALVAAYRCDVDIQGCKFINGNMGAGNTATFALFLNACSGRIHGNRSKNVGYFGYLGHTNAGMNGFNLTVSANICEQFYNAATPTVRGDFVAGVHHNTAIIGNTATGFFTAVALSGFAGTGVFCDDVTIVGNVFENGTAQGIQTDIVGAIKAQRIVITANVIRACGVSGAGIYISQVEDGSITGNALDGNEFGIQIDNSTGIVISSNRITAGAAATKVAGIRIIAATGNVSGIELIGNRVSGYTGTDHYGLLVTPSGGFTVSDVGISGGAYNGNGDGIRISVDCAKVRIGNVTAIGNTLDLRLLALDIAFEPNTMVYATEIGAQYWDLSSATPALAGRRTYRLSNGLTVTSVTGGIDGHFYDFIGAGTFTINHNGTSVSNLGAANRAGAAGGFISYQCRGGVLIEHLRNASVT